MPWAGCQPAASLKHFYAQCSETSSSIIFGVTDTTAALWRMATCSQCNPEQQLEQQEAVEQVMQHVRGKKDLEDLVSAINEGNGGPCPNRELAADLGITVSEVVNRKKRIRRSCRNGFAPIAKATKGATSPMSTDNKRLHGDGPALTPEKRAADIMRVSARTEPIRACGCVPFPDPG